MAEVKQTRSQTKRTGGIPRTPPNEPKEEEGQPSVDPIIPNPKLTPLETTGTEIKAPKSFTSLFFDAEEKIPTKSLTGFEEFCKEENIPLKLSKWKKGEEEEDDYQEGRL